MLPIARRKTLAVPHGLAALAAAVCLALAFATDQTDIEQQMQAEQTEPARMEHLAGDGDAPEGAVPGSESKRSSNRESGIDLLPWFAGFGGRGG